MSNSSNTKEKTQSVHKSKIGGQALFEGVMMRGVGKEAMAVRKKDGSIFVESKDVPANKWYQKTLFIRGVFNFVIQMKNGYRYMMRSMDVSGFLDEEDEQLTIDSGSAETPDNLTVDESEPVKNAEPVENTESVEIKKAEEEFEELKEDIKQEKSKKQKTEEGIIGVLGMVLGLALAIVLFMFVPNWTATALNSLFDIDLEMFHSLIAGIIRIILFVIYMWAISFMKEIRVTYEYHGAEHKTIAAYEAGEELDPENVENVKKYKRFHPRCGTSFIFLVLAISILIYSILPLRPTNIIDYVQQLFGFVIVSWQANIVRTVIQIMLLPFLVGITYEIIKLAGRYDRNIIMRIISAPGLGLQRLTTKEPSEKQLQVAVSAMIPVIPEDKGEDKW